jgi:hypothetical protein
VASLEEQLAGDIASFAYDPAAFVRYAYPWGVAGTPLADDSGPRAWQSDVLGQIGDALKAGYEPGRVLMPVRVAVASGHGIGKSTLVSWLVHWALSTCEDTKAVITANTEPQLRTKTFSEINKWFRLAVNSHWWKVSAMSINSTQRGHEKTWRADGATWSEENLEAFAGLHNKGKRILLLFDEASGIADKVSEVAEGALTDEGTEIIWCQFGNPTQPAGRFFDCFNRHRDLWLRRQIDSRDVPGTNKALFAEWAKAYGEDSDFFRVRVRGQFPRVGSTQFISTEVAEAATHNEPLPLPSDALVLGVDVARFGDDQSVICPRKGRDARSIPWRTYRGLDTMQLAGVVAEMARELNADMVFVDEGGVGGGVVDRLRQLNVIVSGVNFGSKPIRVPGGEPSEGAVRYVNRAAEMWGQMREWLPRGAIPEDQELIVDLSNRQYGFNSDNAIQLERKEDMKRRGLASPDKADALALTFAEPVLPARDGRAGIYGVGGRGVVADYDVFA